MGWKTVQGKSRADIVGAKVERPVPDAQMRPAVRRYHPTDAKFVRSYVTPTARVEVFQSDALAQVFASLPGGVRGVLSAFGNNPPGTFSEYVTGGGLATAIIATLVLGTPI